MVFGKIEIFQLFEILGGLQSGKIVKIAISHPLAHRKSEKLKNGEMADSAAAGAVGSTGEMEFQKIDF